jgi:glutamine---fructose-6-phosphate transaminase (isomerizing)
MCGIFGIALNRDSDIKPVHREQIFTRLFLLSESRGKEASGYALNDGREIKVFKAPVPASDMIRSAAYRKIVSDHYKGVDKFSFAIGHSRLVTSGYEQFNHNNQPIVKYNLVGVHNGIIANDSELWGKLKDEQKITDLDSELIPTLIHASLDSGKNLNHSVTNMYRQIYGMTSIAFLFAGLQNLLLATNNGSLYYIQSRDRNAFVFASERQILQSLISNNGLRRYFDPAEITHLNADQMVLVDIVNAKIESKYIDFDTSTDDFSNLSAGTELLKIHDISYDITKKELFINTSLQHERVKVLDSFIEHVEQCRQRISGLKRCKKCLLPETFPFIDYDNEGICNYCRNYKILEFAGADKFKELLDPVRSKDGSHDCLVPFSGGRDSSFALHYIKKEAGMNPLAYSYDWGMITDLARRNQARLCGRLGVEHILISADIRKKRANIRKNVLAWLRRPELGTIPLFMAGDKQYFYYSNLLQKQNGLEVSVLGENMLETTNFKSGFCGIKPRFGKGNTYSLSGIDKLKMIGFYGKEYLLNPAYINTSLLDTLGAFKSYYMIKHKNINIYNYLQWDENQIIRTLKNEYDWETDPGTATTWRIGDGTAAFYNYIYYIVAGFTENDTFRSNQVRQAMITRREAMDLVNEENIPRFDSIKWYCDTIQIDFENTVMKINQIQKLY